MRNVVTANELNVLNNQKVNTYINLSDNSEVYPENNEVSKILSAEGCENFLQYIEESGLADDPDILILSSQHHYYYDAEEMKNIRTVVNLKEFNQIKDVKSFLQTIYHLLPFNSNFVGCFLDNRKVNVFELRKISSNLQKKTDYDKLEENGIISHVPFINMIYSFMDSRINKYFSARSVRNLLEESGFRVVNMKDMNGITYFHSKKKCSSDE